MNEFEQHMQKQLNASITSIDAKTQSRLAQSRHKALHFSSKNRTGFSNGLTGSISAIAIAVLVVIALPTEQQGNDAFIKITPTNSFYIKDTEDIELYGDLEFYQWLDTIEITS